MATNSRAAARSQANFGAAAEQAQTSKEGETAALQCRISNTAPDEGGGGYVLEWHKESKGLIYSAHNKDSVGKTALDYRGRLRHSGLSLIFSTLRVDDAGVYWCVVKPLKGMAGSIPTGRKIQLDVHAAPDFTKVSESDVYKRFGESARLDCYVKGVPPPEVTWRKDRNPLQARAGLVISETHLSIAEVQASDEGLYECEASNVAGSRKHEMRLHVTGGIRFTDPPRNRSAVEGSDANFPCVADSSPYKVSYQWFFEDEELHAAGTLALRSRVEHLTQRELTAVRPFQDGSLKIQRIAKDDSGWYTCQASDDTGNTAKSKAYLDVQYKPRVLPTTPVMQFVPLGLMGRVRCDIDANPSHTSVQWQKDGAKIYVEDESGRASKEDVNEEERAKGGRYTAEERGAILKIHQVTSADAGEYTCQPSNQLGDGLPFEVRVFYASAPAFSSTPTPLSERTVGQAWTATCSAVISADADDQKPDVFWRRKDGTRVPNARNGRFAIDSVTEFDHGCYDCVVRTKAVELTKEACLRVTGIPPRAPEHLTVTVGAYDADLRWKAGYDGGLQNGSGQYFIVKYRPRPSTPNLSPPWTTANASTSAQLTITHLMPSTDYEFVVEPRSRIGAGVPTPTVVARTKGDNYEDLFVVPTERPGVTYYPNFGAHSIGPRPPTPRNLTFTSDYPSIVFTWHQPSSSLTSKRQQAPVLYYSVEYRQTADVNGEPTERRLRAESQKRRLQPSPTSNFKVLEERVFEPQYRATVNRAPFIAGKTFDVRVKAHSVASFSEPSNLVSFTVPGVPPQTALIAGIAGGVTFLFLCLVLSMLAIRCSKRRKALRMTRDARAVKSHQRSSGNRNSSLVFANGKHRADSITDDTGGFAEWSLHGGTDGGGPHDVSAQSGISGLIPKTKAFSLSLASDDAGESEREQDLDDDANSDGGQVWSTASSASVAPVVIYPSASPSPIVRQETCDVQESDQRNQCPPASAGDLNLDSIEQLNHSSSFQGSSSGIGSLYSYSAIAKEIAVDGDGKWRSGEKQYFNRYDRHRLMDVVEACRRSNRRRGLSYEDKKARAAAVNHMFSVARKNKILPRDRYEIDCSFENCTGGNAFSHSYGAEINCGIGEHGFRSEGIGDGVEGTDAPDQGPCSNCLFDFGDGDNLVSTAGPYVNTHSLRV